MSKIVFYFFITSTQWLCLFSSLCWTTARPLAAILPINRELARFSAKHVASFEPAFAISEHDLKLPLQYIAGR